MTDIDNLAPAIVESLRVRTTRVLPEQIRFCIEALTEEQIWWRPNEKSNSVGNLVLHVCGAVLHFLCRAVGGTEYQRDRPSEFAARLMPKAELLAMFDTMVRQAGETFDAFDAARLGDASTEPAYNSIVFEDLLGIAVHMATHTGQIVYVTKMLQEGVTAELWMQTHRSAGAWKPQVTPRP